MLQCKIMLVNAPKQEKLVNMSGAVLTISSKNYSSWSLRGWLLCRMAGLDFKEELLSHDDPSTRAELLLLSPSFLVPCLTHNGLKVWDTLAIAEYLHEQFPKAGLLPSDPAARSHCRSIAGEMHSGFSNLRRDLPMNVRKSFSPIELSDPVREEIDRILQLWAQARARFGGIGDFLFGEWCAADMMYAPVVTRFLTYAVPIPSFAAVYVKAVLSHPHVAEWIDKAQDEPWVIDQWEVGKAA